jgi:tight adherence protein C
MENVAPPLALCIQVRFRLEAGDALNSTLNQLVQNYNCPMKADLLEMLSAHQKKMKYEFRKGLTNERRVVLSTLIAGLEGVPIRNTLQSIEVELEQLCEMEIDEFVSQLPIRLLFPLVFLMMPGLILLLMGPIFIQILEGLK